MNNLQNNDSQSSTPDDSACDHLARIQARLSSYIARRRDSLDAPFIKNNPNDPDGLAHKVSQLASHLREFLDLKRELSSYPPDQIESTDQFRREGGFDVCWELVLKRTENLPYQSLFVSHDPTARDSDSERDPSGDPRGGTQI